MKGQWKRYPEYRDSGVEWLGEVPVHWRTWRLRFLAEFSPSRSGAAQLAGSTVVSFVPMEAIGEWGGLGLATTRSMDSIGAGYTFFQDSDVVVAKITPCFENGKGALATGLVNGTAFGTTELHVVRPGDDLDGRFLFYLSMSHPFRNIGASTMYGAGGQKRVPERFILNFRPGMPPITEQQAIAAFLDRETQRIDDLIAKKEELIRLLEEKRTALISHVVTKGLDSSVPMKDSGVEWLGEIPAHWEVRRLKHIGSELAGRRIVQPHLYFVENDGVPLLSAINLRPHDIIRDDIKMVSREIDRKHAASRVRDGDLLTVRVGNPGVTAVVPPDLVGCHFASTMLIRARATFDSHWLSHCMNSPVVQAQIDAANYGAAQKQFNVGVAAEFLLPFPPLSDQLAIADHLGAAWTETSRLVSRITVHQRLLREHRQALITAAVTGQIDVRASQTSEVPT